MCWSRRALLLERLHQILVDRIDDLISDDSVGAGGQRALARRCDVLMAEMAQGAQQRMRRRLTQPAEAGGLDPGTTILQRRLQPALPGTPSRAKRWGQGDLNPHNVAVCAF